MLTELRYVLRRLRNSPGFTLTAVLTLAVGIGGVTAVFSIVYAVLLRPLPFHDPAQLVRLHEGIVHQFDEAEMPPPDVITFQRENRAFTGVAGFISAGYEFTGAGEPFMARAERVSASLFPVLGIKPLLGRTFTKQEDGAAAPVAVISYALWRDRFQSNPSVLGRTVDLDRRPYTIIGVMPRSFEFPLDPGRLSQRDLWVPLSLTPQEMQMEGDNFDYSAVARLRPGITMAQAQADVDRVLQGIQAGYPPQVDVHLIAAVVPLKDETVRDARPLLRVLLAAVFLVLLIACANLANLLLVRAAGRRREFGVRLALGAAYPTMLRQLLTESFVLSVIGGAIGLLLAATLIHVAPAFLPDSLPRLAGLSIHWPVLCGSALLIVATGVACGLAPALSGLRTDVIDALRDGGHAAGQSRSQHNLRNVLVVVETALAMLLLVGSGLLLRSFERMLAVDPGFPPEHLLTASIMLPHQNYPTQQRIDDFYHDLGRRLEPLPGVHAVGFSSNIPFVGANSQRMFAPGGYAMKPGEGRPFASNYLIQGDYFEALHVPLLRGRYLDASDDSDDAPLTAVVSQSLAKRYWPHQDAVGRRLKFGASVNNPMPWVTVVGVVGDVKQASLDTMTMPQMYEPLSQTQRGLGVMAKIMGVRGDMRAVLRTSGDPAALAASLLKTVHQLDPLLAVTDVQTMDAVVSSTEAPRRFNTAVLTAFAGIALLLALLGIYGVLAYTVTERTREIAIRMALGSTREAILRRTVRSGMVLASVGIAGGLAASVGLTRYLSSLLYGVRPMDAISIAGAVAVLLVCAAIAGWLPARRAASVDPMQALRSE